MTLPARSTSGRSAFQPLYSRAPAATAWRASTSSKSWRLRESPKSGYRPSAGQSMCTRCSPATHRMPRERVQPGAEMSTPIRISWCTARGVRPSPQTFSRGKRAFSSRITSTPARARWYAADEPAGPAPTTITCASSPARGSGGTGSGGMSRINSPSTECRWSGVLCRCPAGTTAPGNIIGQDGPGRNQASVSGGSGRNRASGMDGLRRHALRASRPGASSVRRADRVFTIPT